MNWLSKHSKSLLALAGALFMLVEPHFVGSATFATHDWINVGITAAGAVGAYVYANTNATVGQYAKGITVALSAALVTLNNVVDGGVTTQEGWQIGVAVLVALGVIVYPTSQPQAVLPGGPQRAAV